MFVYEHEMTFNQNYVYNHEIEPASGIVVVHQYVRSLKDGKDLVDRLSLAGSKVVSNLHPNLEKL